MSKIEKAYIIRISSELSRQYAKDVSKSCEKINLPFEFFNGTEQKSGYDAWNQSGLDFKPLGLYKSNKTDKAACASVSHALLWKKIYENKETAIILEHDGHMLQPVNELNIPDNMIVVLGYKLTDPSKYDHKRAGKPKTIKIIDGHEGAHAYAITWKTAGVLLNELKEIGVNSPVDNKFFLKMRETKVTIGIADPTPAIGWIRQSTIWPEAATLNYEFIESFKNNVFL